MHALAQPSTSRGMQICFTKPPTLVFQCSGCRSVISDSLLFICSIEALNVLVSEGGLNYMNAHRAWVSQAQHRCRR